MFDASRLDRLTSAYFDRGLDAVEMRELETMLLGSSRARQWFLDQAEWHGLTRQWALQGRMSELMGGVGSGRMPGAGLAAPRTVIPFRRYAAIAAGIAACVALTWVLIRPSSTPVPGIARSEVETSRAGLALLGQASDVEWEGNAASYGVGAALPPGLVKIRRGTLRLDFYSGARVFLEGPASLDLLSPEFARLDLGKLTARVPAAAAGFTVACGDFRVVDRGTEFGMNRTANGRREVHVFEGQVDLQGNVPQGLKRRLSEGEAVAIDRGQWTSLRADRRAFSDPALMHQAADRETGARWEAWRAASRKLMESSDLLVHFDFEQIDPGAMIVKNRAPDANENSDGSVIGCELLSGRWSKKSALGFTSTSDRVRFRMEGLTPSLTLMAWVRVDSLAQDHNALFSMAPDAVGEVHWKLDKSGCLLIGLRASPEFSYDSWERLASPQIVTRKDFGRWMHLATVIDGDAGTMRHFVNGEEVASGPLKRHPQIQLGLCNLGNFDEAKSGRPTFNEVHSFNGRIDEFAAFQRALSAEEIAELK